MCDGSHQLCRHTSGVLRCLGRGAVRLRGLQSLRQANRRGLLPSGRSPRNSGAQGCEPHFCCCGICGSTVAEWQRVARRLVGGVVDAEGERLRAVMARDQARASELARQSKEKGSMARITRPGPAAHTAFTS